MAKIKIGNVSNVEELVTKSDRSLENINNTPLVKYIGSTPIFVNYYSQSQYTSTQSLGYRDNNALHGEDSGLRFNQIKHMPIFLEGALARDKDSDKEYTGIQESGEGSALLLPNTIEALVNDIIEIKFKDNRSTYFKVTATTLSTFKSNPYTKIDFKLDNSPTLKNMGIDQGQYFGPEQIIGRWTCIYANIGTEYKAIVREDAAILIGKLKELYLQMSTKYIRNFYDLFLDGNGTMVKNAAMFNKLCFNKGRALYAPFVNDFIVNNRLLYDSKGNGLYLVSEYDRPSDIDLYNDISQLNKISFNKFPLANLDPFSELYNCTVDFDTILATALSDDVLPEDKYTLVPEDYKYHNAEKHLIAVHNQMESSLINTLDLDKISELLVMEDLYSYIMTPYHLYLMKQIINYMSLDETKLDNDIKFWN